MHPVPPVVPTPEVAPALRHALGQALLQPVGLASVFYRRLFELAPAARALFPEDLGPQQDKLTRSLLMLLQCLDDPQALVTAVQQLGARHVHYGVQAGHYLPVGQALEASFAECLGADFDQAARTAWQRLYGWVAVTMLAGSARNPHVEV